MFKLPVGFILGFSTARLPAFELVHFSNKGRAVIDAAKILFTHEVYDGGGGYKT
jgi:hypothetical protein